MLHFDKRLTYIMYQRKLSYTSHSCHTCITKWKLWVLTIYTEKPEIPVGKSNGTSSSVRNVPEKVGGRLR